MPKAQEAVIDQALQPFLPERAVDVGHLFREVVVEQHAPDGRVDRAIDLGDRGLDHVLRVALGVEIDQTALVAQADLGLRRDLFGVEREHHLFRRGEGAAFALRALQRAGHVVTAEHDVLRRHGDGLAGSRREDVVRREHQDLRLDLRFGRERDVDRHLVAVEVGVERRADERVNLDRLAFDQHRLEGLDAQAVERRRAVEQDRVILNHLLEDVPDHVVVALDHLLGLFDRRGVAFSFEPVVDERLEQLQGHLLRQAALVQLQLGADDDHRASRIIDALAEQVLAEAPLLAFERVGERFERAVVDAAQHAPPAAVVEQRVHGLLEHSLLVADDDFRRLQLDQLRKPVIAVDDAAVEVVQIRSGEPSAVERDERAQFGRDDRDHVQDHPFRLVARLAERVDDFEPLREFELLLLARLVFHLVSQLFGQVLDVDLLEQGLDGLRPHLANLVGELAGELLLELPVALVGDHLALFEREAQAVDIFLVRDDDVVLEVENLLELAQGDVEQVSDAAGQSFEEPDVRTWAGQFYVAEPLAADFRLCDLDAAFVADHAAMLHALVFSAQALPIRHRAEDARAEQAVALRLECAVVDSFRFRDVAVRPRTNLFRRSEADANRFEIRRKRLLSCISNHFPYSLLEKSLGTSGNRTRRTRRAYRPCW